MNSQPGQTLTAFVMLVPLVIVPAIALFGVPGQDSLSSTSDKSAIEDVRVPSMVPRSVPPPTLTSIPNDPINVVRPTSGTSAADGGWSNPFDASAVNDPAGPTRTASIADSISHVPSRATTHQPIAQQQPLAGQEAPATSGVDRANGQSLTWVAAVEQLNRLGIDNYRLENGDQENAFHFCAFHSPRGQSSVLYRFEAEASEPLAAVADVLTQIEQWHAER